MKIAIQGHPTRGKEVIQILESLGGKNTALFKGNQAFWYFINSYNNIVNDYEFVLTRAGFKTYTLEEFEKEFPFKVGDIVLLKGVNKPYEIVALEWYMNKLCYKLDNELHYAPETLTTYKEMKEERNITLTLDKAKEWYNKGGELKEIALQAFSETELNPLSRSWEKYIMKYGACCFSTRYTNIPLKYDALLKLEQLRDCWRQGWKPDWNDDQSAKYCVICHHEEFKINVLYNTSRFLSFPTHEIAEEFLKCFRDLIEKAGDLI